MPVLRLFASCPSCTSHFARVHFLLQAQVPTLPYGLLGIGLCSSGTRVAASPTFHARLPDVHPVIKPTNRFQHRPIWWFRLSIATPPFPPLDILNSGSDRSIIDDIHTHAHAHTHTLSLSLTHTYTHQPLATSRPALIQPPSLQLRWLISAAHPCFHDPPCPVQPTPTTFIHRKSPPPPWLLFQRRRLLEHQITTHELVRR